MQEERIIGLSIVYLMVTFFVAEPLRAAENVRVAYPSMSASVVFRDPAASAIDAR